MNVSEFSGYWQKHFPNCPPVSYLFKWKLADRWFRFHSLPGSKRYADTASEIKELLSRQNTVLFDVIGEGKECIMVAGDYSESPGELINGSRCPILARFILHALPSIPKQDFDPEPLEEDEPPVYLRLAYGVHVLRRGMLDEVLLCVADERITNFFVVSVENSRIFAPYDGGVDVVLRDSAERDDFKSRYGMWLSERPDGL